MSDDVHPLDDPVRTSLTGAHASLAESLGRVIRYQVDVSPFLALPAVPEAQDWMDLATLAGPGSAVNLRAGADDRPPPGWQVTVDIPGVQLVDDGVHAEPDDEAVVLARADVPDMLALVEATRPGPFLTRTVEMGRYLGIRRGGRLVAMAGERMRPPGWTEISAVCTDPAHRGQGLSSRLMRAVAHGIRQRGELPFLHAAASNTTAIGLYESLGFRVRRTTSFQNVRVPDGEPAQPGSSPSNTGR